MSEFSETPWHALYVRARQEKKVKDQLDAKAHEAFLPLYESWHRWSDRWRNVSIPLFPGYVFCRFNPVERTSVLSTSGVIDLVRVGPQLAVVRPDEIEAIQRILVSQLPAEPYAGLVKGDAVTMIEGPLKGLTGMLTEVRRGLRLVVSVDMLCRSVLVEIDRDWVVPYSATAMATVPPLLSSVM